MSGFSIQWLQLREPYDRAARNRTVLEAVSAVFRDQPSIAVVDLACGTGSTLRATAQYLPGRQYWRLVDNDLGLLAQASMLARPPDRIVAAKPVDLMRDLELALEAPLDLVTASALLDLVSAPWLDRLIEETAARRLPVYAALGYDGTISFEPNEPGDQEVVEGRLERPPLLDEGRQKRRASREIGTAVTRLPLKALVVLSHRHAGEKI